MYCPTNQRDCSLFDIYSNTDGFVSAFETDVPKASLSAGFSSANVPDGTTVIRVKAKGVCTNYIDITLPTITTTTTATTTATTTITTTAESDQIQTKHQSVLLVKLNSMALGGSMKLHFRRDEETNKHSVDLTFLIQIILVKN